MLCVAWAANQHIGARTKLAVLPADDDVLAIYDLSTTTGKGIEVAVFRGTNLNAIVDAYTGVGTPGMTLYDNDNEGEEVTADDDKFAGFVGVNCTDTTEDSEDCDLLFQSMAAGTNTQRAMFDADGTDDTDSQWEFDYPVHSVQVDGGVNLAYATAAYSIQSSFPSQCEMVVYFGSHTGVVAATLPNEPLCDGVNGNPMNSKHFRIINMDTDGIDLTP